MHSTIIGTIAGGQTRGTGRHMADTLETPTSRLELVMGKDAVGRLANACVVVLGLGGVGSNCAEALARGGVGSLVLVDRDVVEPSNINRQAVAYTSTVGQRKTDVMARLVADINPSCKIEPIHVFLTRDNIGSILGSLDPRPDFVVDAIDNVTAKLVVARWCQDEGMPLVSSMGGANKLHPELLRFADISQTHGCPLARIIRKECRKRGIRGLRVLYSPEEPVRPQAPEGASGKAATLGTMSYFPPIMGQMIAGDVILSLTGLDDRSAASGGGTR